MSESALLILASLIGGSACLVWRGKRRFKRLNPLGIEQYSSYSNKLWATSLETLLLGGGYGLIGGAGIIFAIEYAQPLLSILCVLSVIWIIQMVHQKSKIRK